MLVDTCAAALYSGAMRVACLVALLLAGTPARAHETMLGPAAPLLESAAVFTSASVTSRRLARSQESTLTAGAAAPLAAGLSLALMAPLAYISQPGDRTFGPDDAALGLRFRLELTPLRDAFDREGNYLLVMAAVDLPTGSIDHPAFDGPLDGMVALVAATAWRDVSGALLAFYTRRGNDDADDLLFGARAAWTPWDDALTRELLSLELGVSSEIHFAPEVDRAVLLHPCVRWNPGGRFALFAAFGMPLWQGRADGEAWRATAGVVLGS